MKSAGAQLTWVEATVAVVGLSGCWLAISLPPISAIANFFCILGATTIGIRLGLALHDWASND